METVLIVFIAVVFLLGGMVGWILGRRSLRRSLRREYEPRQNMEGEPAITGPQVHFIHSLSKRLKRPPPENLDEFSKMEASELIDDLRDELEEDQGDITLRVSSKDFVDN